MEIYSGYAALYILMSLVPLVMLVISAGMILSAFSAEDVCGFLYRLLPNVPEVQEMMENIVTNLLQQSGRTVVSISAVTTLWSASNGLSAIQAGLEKIRGTRRPSFKGKPRALLFTVLYVLLIPALLVFQILRSSVESLLNSLFTALHLDPLISKIPQFMGLSSLIVLAASILIIVLTYTWLPAGRKTLKSQLPGAVSSCVFCTAFTLGFSWFIPRFWKASSIYGSLAAVFLTAMWLNIMITILFYGAALNRALEDKNT
ncbi:MAG: YihY/virulence factor BrkB family protein [Solobacterium sp.]|nr:YihY/virulence factor BrkB family protein [Solobacterium sp.]